jgi:uncharacterized RDD family membrane protein YckC
MTNISDQPAVPAAQGLPNYAPTRLCPSCSRDWGGGMTCQFCAQVSGLPNGVRLSSAGKRFGGYVLETVLFVVTLGLGWLIWSLIVWKDGKTPAKGLLGMRVLKLQTGAKATWGNMFFREVFGKIVGGIVGAVTFGITTFMLLWDNNRQEIWDKVAGTIVIDDPHKQLT